MIKKALVILCVLAAILAVFYLYLNNRNDTGTISNENNSLPSNERINTPDSEAVSELERGGNSFSDPDSIFSVLYPNEYKQDIQGENRYRIYKQGPTQRGQTEMYDGVIINFETIDLESKNLSDWIDERISLSTQDGTSELIEEKTPINVNGYPGYTYTMRGLGTFENLAIQKDQNSKYAVITTSLIADPSGAGFEKEFENILSTLTLHK